MRFFVFLCAIVAVQAYGSPHGQDYLQSLSDKTLSQISNNIIEDSLLNVVELIKKYGYPCETHEVKTADDYILTMHRIPGGRNGAKADKKVPVFLQHGLLMSSTDWIINGPEKALGYILADQGFDVWMGNARGNFYSRKHASLDPDKSSKYWKFSWNEIGYFDLPAMIDYVLKNTSRADLHYIGHSQGTTSFFVMASERKDYNKKIRSMHAMAPVAYMGNLKSPLVRLLAPMANAVESFTSLVGMNEFLPNSDFMTLASHLLCGEGSIFVPVCTNVLFLLAGYNPNQLNNTMLPLYMSHTPAGSATRQLVHYGQEVMSKKFRQYDHGFFSNMGVYGSTSPPRYSLKTITAPVFLHYSDNDWLSEPVDVDQLGRELGNLIGKFRVPMKEFNHLDYMWGVDSPSLIYSRIINLIIAFE